MDASLERIIAARPRSIGAFTVGRVLPVAQRRSVGPFVFLDHMGPVTLAAGEQTDVLPHPHIGLSTVTYLFDGEMVHRDSVGSTQTIRPGDVNWMTAGRGVVHSERAPPHLAGQDRRLHGLQIWVALPRAHEETEPFFAHHPVATLPTVQLGNSTARLVVGSLLGQRSPVRTFSRTLYLDAPLQAGQTFELGAVEEELAVYVVEGTVRLHGEVLAEKNMGVMARGAGVVLVAQSAARVVVVGGEPLDGPRFMWWNFVSSRRERVEEAKRQWREQAFPPIEGETEFVPLPEGPG